MRFGVMLLLAGTLLHAYVAWRGAGVPAIERHVSRRAYVAAAAVLWLLFAAASLLGHGTPGAPAAALETFGLTCLATLFLLAVALLPVDLVTCFGLLAPRLAPRLRGWALAAGVGLAAVALVQGTRPPVVTAYQVAIPGLPPDADRTVLVALSDLHLGSVLGARWLAARVEQVRALRPDAVLLLGDVFEGHGRPGDDVIAELRKLSAPLGSWAVTGNHESHGGRGTGAAWLEDAGFTVLHDRWAEPRPGLVIAGVDDLTSRRRSGVGGDPVGTALAGRPPGAVVLLSHTPWEAERAARHGAGLMLSGHTHAGQIWPFSYLVQAVYPLLEGRYRVEGMTVIVGRGTGTWGPRMRLWRPAEILKITLHSAPAV